MNGRRVGGLFLLATLLASPGLLAMELNGAIATENYLGLKEGQFYNFRNANLFQLKVKGNPSEQVAGHANLELRNTNFTDVQFVDDLWDRGSVDPVSWRINEAYVDIYGFLLDGDSLLLDIRAGKQNIAWGEADSFNPTNNFDPYNLENPMDFKERLGNVALKASLTIADELFILEGVVAPRFLPAVLPVDLFIGDDPFNSPLMPNIPPELFQTLEDLNIDLVNPGNDVIRTRVPSFEAGNLMAGARLKWSMLGFDWSLSYFHGRDSIPTLAGSQGEIRGSVDDGCPEVGRSCVVITEVTLTYPEIDVLGFDFRGGIGDVGVWGELGLIFPRELTADMNVGLLGVALDVIEEEPFAKWTLGAEYTFSGGYYFNLQWVHGFFDEQTGHDLHDYLFLVFRKGFLSDRLRLEMSLGGELDTTLGRQALAGLAYAQLSYKPYDGAEVILGYILARGEDGTGFSAFEELDQVYLKIRADF